nr:hypothetical protein [Tanacetum cinerariifolium]
VGEGRDAGSSGAARGKAHRPGIRAGARRRSSDSHRSARASGRDKATGAIHQLVAARRGGRSKRYRSGISRGAGHRQAGWGQAVGRNGHIGFDTQAHGESSGGQIGPGGAIARTVEGSGAQRRLGLRGNACPIATNFFHPDIERAHRQLERAERHGYATPRGGPVLSGRRVQHSTRNAGCPIRVVYHHLVRSSGAYAFCKPQGSAAQVRPSPERKLRGQYPVGSPVAQDGTIEGAAGLQVSLGSCARIGDIHPHRLRQRAQRSRLVERIHRPNGYVVGNGWAKMVGAPRIRRRSARNIMHLGPVVGGSERGAAPG